jgi:hypothetical protein
MSPKKRKKTAPPPAAVPAPPPAPPPQEPERGLSCRRCGCRDLRVIYTRQRRIGIVRRRECRFCGHRTTTWERQTGDGPLPGRQPGVPLA